MVTELFSFERMDVRQPSVTAIDDRRFPHLSVACDVAMRFLQALPAARSARSCCNSLSQSIRG